MSERMSSDEIVQRAKRIALSDPRARAEMLEYLGVLKEAYLVVTVTRDDATGREQIDTTMLTNIKSAGILAKHIMCENVNERYAWVRSRNVRRLLKDMPHPRPVTNRELLDTLDVKDGIELFNRQQYRMNLSIQTITLYK